MPSGNHGSGPIPPPFSALGPILEPIYRLAINHRNRGFTAGRGVVRLPLPVISVGNLSVGGTGKTPLVAHIVSMLLRAGRHPLIAMRGYTKSSAASSPDETDLYQRDFPNVPIVAQPNRAAGILTLLASVSDAAKPDCIVLDDGFQHRQIARDLDIVIIDASRSPFEDRLLPAGWLREPVQSLARAGIIILSHTELVTQRDLATLHRHLSEALSPSPLSGRSQDPKIPRSHTLPPLAHTRHIWTALSTDSPVPEAVGGRLPLDWVLGKRVVAACAIGNPEGFLHCLRATLDSARTRSPATAAPGGTLAAAIVLPDHDPFSPGTVQRLLDSAATAKADVIMVTEKDWSKLRRLPADTWKVRRHGERAARPIPVIRPVLSMVFDAGPGVLGPPEFEERILSFARTGAAGASPA